MPDPLTMSAIELAAAIRQRELSSREVVGAHVERARAINPAVNAIVVERYEHALLEADAADARITRAAADQPLPALLGVPCTIKESFAVAGLPNTSGLVRRRDVVAREDATTVARLRRAGAICIGLTNVSELCMWMESNNRVYGRSNNPYDPRCIVGGSSGGEGAAVGAGVSPFGLAARGETPHATSLGIFAEGFVAETCSTSSTAAFRLRALDENPGARSRDGFHHGLLGADIGGSIRMPAFFCGVFGHKSTGGLVPGTGMHPISENAALRYLTTGPIARRAGDLMPLLRLLAGPDGRDQGVRELELHDPEAVDLSRLEVWVVEDDGKRSVDIEMLDALERAAQTLARRGASSPWWNPACRIAPGFSSRGRSRNEVVPGVLRVSATPPSAKRPSEAARRVSPRAARVRRRRIPEFGRAFELWSAGMTEASETSFRTLLDEGEPIRVGRELLRWALRRSEHTLPALVLAGVEELWPIAPSTERRRALVAEGLALQAQINALLSDNGLLLYPSYSRPAPRHYGPLLRPFGWTYTAIFNVLELPVTQVPMGLSRAGLPLGVQVVGANGNDHLTIAAALELERAHGGWVRPPRNFTAKRVAT